MAVENDHAHIAAYRAVESGFAMLRPDANGLPLAVDPMGRELARGAYYTTDRLDTIAVTPVQSLSRLYSRIGDGFAYARIIAISALTVLAFAPGLRPSTTNARRHQSPVTARRL
jgi:apolipoprotein N-acyltransferase